MTLLKFGENLQFSSADIKPANVIENDPYVMEQFKKIADNLKRVAPKANDFLYFSAAMMHSAERSLYNDDGTIKTGKDGNPVEAHWEINEKTGSWKWICSDPDIKPYKNCFLPGTLVTMEDGTVKNIEDIEAGDMVITHKNEAKKVLKTFITPHSGKILEIKSRGRQELFCTPEHPFYNLDVTNANGEKKDTAKHILRRKKVKTQFLFKNGSMLNKYDLLLGPVINKTINNSNITPGKARLLGLFAAEGSFGKKYNKDQNLVFTFNINEYEVLALPTKDLFEKEFDNCSVNIKKRNSNNTCDVLVTGNNICNFFRQHVGEYSQYKTLSEDLVFGNEKIKMSFIAGWLDGDGCVEKQFGQLIGVTISKNLMSQISLMLNSMQIGHGISKVEGVIGKIINPKYKPCDTQPVYRITINATENNSILKLAQRLHITNRGVSKKQNLFFKDYSLHSVTKTYQHEYYGNVYNLEVEEDNSYVVNGIITHNCNLDIFPEQELKKAYKKWVGKPLCKDHQSSSIDGVRGIILDTYYDDKAKQVVALCALDKVNYGPLARAVEAGYANSVSMGTAVGKSICTECGNVAKTENEYCDHVRARRAYGEINIDLAPIELSLVVNGADPLARVRTIIAQTQHIEDTLKKSGQATSIDQLMSIKQDFSALAFKIGELEIELGAKADNNMTLKAVAKNDINQEEFTNGLVLIKNKMANVESMIQKIANRFNTEELTSMSKINKEAYYQGTEEPKPGTPQYAKEEADSIRNSEDRQMKNVVDTGPVDGLFPGDLEKKKMIARAKADERRQLRANAVAKAKLAYVQGTEEPKKDKTYTPDPLAEKARKEDKQMVVQDPGKGDLMPGDKEAKEKVLRAKLKARFVKAASPEQNRWDILNGDTVILSATFNEITGGRSALFSSVKTAEFAKEMMKTIKAKGVKEASQLYKSAQVAPPAADPMGGMGMDMGGAGADPMGGAGADPMGGMDMAPMGGGVDPMGMDMGEQGGSTLEGIPETVADPVERGNVAIEVLEKNVTTFSTNIQELIAEIKAGYETLNSQGGQLAGAGGGEAAAALAAPEQTVTASLKALKKGATGPESTKALRNIQVVLNAGLKDAFKKTAEELQEAKEELDTISSTLSMPGINSVNQDFVNNLATEAINEASAVIAKANALKSAFIKYARGAFGLEKKAAIENRMLKLAQQKKEEEKKEEAKGTRTVSTTPKVEPAKPKTETQAEPVTPPGTPKEASDRTIEEKKMYRQKLAAKAMQMSEMLGQAHPSGSASLGGLDYKSSEAVVEDLVDIHSKMEQVATTDPKVSEKTKKNAERIDSLIKAGKMNAAELDDLVKHGLDKDAVAYWKKYFGSVEGGSEFATELVKEYAHEKKASVDVEQYKVKLASAYDLAYEMAEVGLISNNRQAIKKEVESIVKWTDEAFQSMKRVIAHHRPNLTKEASLEVGIAFDSNVTSGAQADNSLLGELNEVFSGRNYLGRK